MFNGVTRHGLVMGLSELCTMPSRPSSAAPRSVTFSITPHRANLPLMGVAVRAIVAEMKLGVDATAALDMAVIELVANLIRYGYSEEAPEGGIGSLADRNRYGGASGDDRPRTADDAVGRKRSVCLRQYRHDHAARQCAQPVVGLCDGGQAQLCPP